MALRDHGPFVIEEFNGLWRRGDPESCPSDHWFDSENMSFIESGFETRPGLDTLIAQGNVLRVFNYKMQTGESLLILTVGGDVYHALLDGSDTVYGPILSIEDMTDFKIHFPSGYAYITPFTTYTDMNGVDYQKGLEDEFVYVYKGDGTAARKAAGFPPTNDDDTPLVVWNTNTIGLIDQGIHVVAVTFDDGLGGESTGLGPTVLPILYAPGNKEAIVANIPITVMPGLTGRKIWMTHAIDPKDYDPSSLPTFYLAKTINDVTTTSTIISIADESLTTPFVAGVLPNPTSGGITAENTNTEGHCDVGLHVIGVVYETDTGFLTAPGPEVFAVQTFANEKRAIHIKNIPVSPDSFVTKRHLVSSKMVRDYNGDDRGFQLFFIPDGTIEDNVTTELVVSYYDSELLEDASHLIDNFSEIPAGAVLSAYNGRMVVGATFDDPSLLHFSAPGEPEAIDQVDGNVILPLDGNPATNGQEYREVFYGFKKTRTYAITDNGDFPSTWEPVPLDQGVGASVHGVCQVLDSGGVNVDYLLIVDYSGLMLFNGYYARPSGEMTWKVEDLWFDLDRNAFGNIQVLNDSLSKKIYITLPNKRMLYGDYTNGLTPQNIKWEPWKFDIETTTIALIETNTVVIGAEQEAS